VGKAAERGVPTRSFSRNPRGHGGFAAFAHPTESRFDLLTQPVDRRLRAA
jgi:hypothetical protein